MNNLRSEEHHRLNKQYRQRYEQQATQRRQARDVQQQNKPRKSVNIIRVISQILVNIR